MKKFKEYRIAFALSLCSLLFLASCASREDVVYFQDVGNFETATNTPTTITKFKVDDVVSINVSSLNPEASAPFNIVSSGDGLRAEPMDYLVDQDGMIDFPVIGKLKIEGLSPDELRIMLRERLSEYLKDPIINIRLRNFSVTVLGAVTRPGTYTNTTTGEQLTILEGLGLAGDMTIRGRRDNVLVIREFKGTKVYTRIDLTSKDIVESPVYYLTQNDVVYVEPNKQGINETSIGASTALTFSIISLLITSTLLIVTRF
jgi:polysaccharide export outer membrane protein